MSKVHDINEQTLRYHLINKYRELISRRYDEVIRNIDKTHLHLSPSVALGIKNFFLDNVYPEPAKRKNLDAAFAELRTFTTNPALIWGLLGSLPAAIFRFGAQLPHAIRAGLTTLQAYTSAIGFEEAMLHTAIAKGYHEPISDEQFYDCLRTIPRRSLDAFINEASVLFIVISDATLLSKTIGIMEDVILRMKGKPELYSASQIGAIEMGLDLMAKGQALLNPYTEETKKAIIDFIMQSEMAFVAELYEA